MPKVGVFAAIFDGNDRILCVKINYGSGNWTLPGGHLEKYESPYEGTKREVLEETGYIVDIENLISVYSAPEKDDIVFLFKARIKRQIEWKPNNEIQIALCFKLEIELMIARTSSRVKISGRKTFQHLEYPIFD